jgi:hypothetical protein
MRKGPPVQGETPAACKLPVHVGGEEENPFTGADTCVSLRRGKRFKQREKILTRHLMSSLGVHVTGANLL